MKSIYQWMLMGLIPIVTHAAPPPSAPTDPSHAGSKIYLYGSESRAQTCQGRKLDVFVPSGETTGKTYPFVVFGHGQALGLSAYRATFEHLAKKGVGVVFPAYSNGFFDQDWTRMGQDYVSITDCALAHNRELDSSRVVYAGHSKGAYVASIAAGLAPGMNAKSSPKAIVLFAPAGHDTSALRKIAPNSALTVVFAEQDRVVSRDISEAIFTQAGSRIRQFILLKSYPTSPALPADHMWPLTERNFLGGGPEGALHYYGSWKWLVAAADDLSSENKFQNPYLYGDLAIDKGVEGLRDEVRRSGAMLSALGSEIPKAARRLVFNLFGNE